MGEGKFIFNPENQDSDLAEQHSDQHIAGAAEEEVLLFQEKKPVYTNKKLEELRLAGGRQGRRRKTGGVLESPGLISPRMEFDGPRIRIEIIKDHWGE